MDLSSFREPQGRLVILEEGGSWSTGEREIFMASLVGDKTRLKPGEGVSLTCFDPRRQRVDNEGRQNKAKHNQSIAKHSE